MPAADESEDYCENTRELRKAEVESPATARDDHLPDDKNGNYLHRENAYNV